MKEQEIYDVLQKYALKQGDYCKFDYHRLRAASKEIAGSPERDPLKRIDIHDRCMLLFDQMHYILGLTCEEVEIMFRRWLDLVKKRKP